VGLQPSSTWIAGVLTVALIVAALAVMLIVQTRAGRRLDASLHEARRFRKAVGDVLRAGSMGSDSVTDASLRRLADAMDVDEVWHWQYGDPADPAWSHVTLQRGELLVSATLDDLPRPLRQRLAGRQPNASVLMTPLAAEGGVLGVLCWISWRRITWSLDQIERFKVFSTLVAGDIQRKRSSEALQRGHALKDAILSSLPARIAVLDRRGSIIAVNASWAEARWLSAGTERVEPGANFFELCRAAARDGCVSAADTAAGVAAVCEGRHDEFELEYPVADADAERWFLMKTTPLQQEDGGAVVTHTDITVRKRAELLVRESEERFRRLADVLPVGVWMSGIDGAREYVNRTWIDLTGRSRERQLGIGWLEAVHPEDRERCMGTYLRAFEKRAQFSMEYRIRRYDGEYRWLLDMGVPRYDVGTSFAGYLGGAIDFTVQREAEQTLRELSGKRIAAQEEERRRIARDLHDSVGQRMALVSIRLHELRKRVGATGEVAAILDHLWADSEAIAREVHSLSHRLHSAKLDALGLVGAVASECREMSEHGVVVQFSDHAVPPVSSDIGLCVFRIVQAALSNVVKHSRASSAQVTMTADRHVLVVKVQDGGVGFVADQRVEGLGLVSIRERVRSIGGELKVRSAPGQGTVIEACVPVKSVVAAPSSVFNRTSSLRFDNSPPPFLSDTSRTAPG
jgi:PAS domain S-box-containing protein